MSDSEAQDCTDFELLQESHSLDKWTGKLKWTDSAGAAGGAAGADVAQFNSCAVTHSRQRKRNAGGGH